MATAGKHGVSTNTPQNILFGAGTVHFGLEYNSETSSWNTAETIVGATKEGTTLSIVPSFYEVEPDGALVAVKNLTKKIGETATLKVNFLEISPELLQKALIAEEGTSADNDYKKFVSKANIEEGDYVDISVVGETLDGELCIVTLHNALCVSGFELDKKNKEASTTTLEFKCHADCSGDLDVLPYEIYYPNRA